MFKIGEFSRFSRVSVKMLRHYDEIGLFKPAQTDTQSGYRYYMADQLPRLNRIVALKDLGFSLEQIQQLLDDNLNNDEIRGMLKLKRAEIQRRVTEDQQRLAQLNAHLSHLDEDHYTTLHGVVIRQIPSQLYATMRARVLEDSKAVSLMFEETESYVAKHKARAPYPPLMIYHETDYAADTIDVEVAIPVNHTIPNCDKVTLRELQGVKTMACVIHLGHYDALGQVAHMLMRWIEANHYQVCGPMREVYLRFGADEDGYTIPDAYLTNGHDEFVTELQLPVEQILEA